jgi:hypothetical protein
MTRGVPSPGAAAVGAGQFGVRTSPKCTALTVQRQVRERRTLRACMHMLGSIWA